MADAGPGEGDDATVLLQPQRTASRFGVRWFVLLGLLVVAGGVGGWWVWAPAPGPSLAPAAQAVRPASAYRIVRADEATIRDDAAPAVADAAPFVFRFAANGDVLVLDFTSLHAQGAMLNRVAALVEKAGLPRDHVLDDAALARAIHDGGETADTYYYGHDYRAADLARFFALAARDGVVLTPQEVWLRGLVTEQGWLAPGAVGALISIPRAGTDAGLDAAARAAILRHELSHGEYFTRPAYAAVTRHFWEDVLTADQRGLFRRFLAGEGYDAAQEDLMMNEAQAYLMHTPDLRFFNAAALGVSPDQLATWRLAFYRLMAPGWLRDETPGGGATAPVAAIPAAPAASSARRRRRAVAA
jgi:hypothetical protein